MKKSIMLIMACILFVNNIFSQDAEMQGYKVVKVKNRDSFDKTKSIIVISETTGYSSKRLKQIADAILDCEDILKGAQLAVIHNPKADKEVYEIEDDAYFKSKDEVKLQEDKFTIFSKTDLKSYYVLNFSIDSLYDSPFDNILAPAGYGPVPNIWILKLSLYEQDSRRIIATGEIEDYRVRLYRRLGDHISRFFEELEYK